MAAGYLNRCLQWLMLIGLAMGGLGFARHKLGPSQSKDAGHRLMVVGLETIHDEYTYHSRLSPINAVTVSTEHTGIINELYHHFGDRVERGELLLEIKINHSMKNIALLSLDFYWSRINLIEQVKNFPGPSKSMPGV